MLESNSKSSYEDAYKDSYSLKGLGNPSSQIVPFKLDGSNFPLWKKHFEMAVSMRQKLSFLLGEVSEPDPHHDLKEHRKWKTCHDMVHS